MALSIVTDSTVEPVSVAELKAHARVSHESDDVVLGGMITAARQWCEAYVARPLTGGRKTYRLTLDSFYDERYTDKCGRIRLDNPPLSTSSTDVAITYLDSSSGGSTTLASTNYLISYYHEPALLEPAWGHTWPATRDQTGAVTVQFTAGYSTPGDVPRTARTAVMMLASQLYEQREAGAEASVSEVPFGVRALLDPVKWGSYP